MTQQEVEKVLATEGSDLAGVPGIRANLRGRARYSRGYPEDIPGTGHPGEKPPAVRRIHGDIHLAIKQEQDVLGGLFLTDQDRRSRAIKARGERRKVALCLGGQVLEELSRSAKLVSVIPLYYCGDQHWELVDTPSFVILKLFLEVIRLTAIGRRCFLDLTADQP